MCGNFHSLYLLVRIICASQGDSWLDPSHIAFGLSPDLFQMWRALLLRTRHIHFMVLPSTMDFLLMEVPFLHTARPTVWRRQKPVGSSALRASRKVETRWQNNYPLVCKLRPSAEAHKGYTLRKQSMGRYSKRKLYT